MKMRTVLCLLVVAILLGTAESLAQVSKQTIGDQDLEQEFIDSRAKLGDSHASGARKELGPVTLGNPTTVQTIIRVGLSYSTLNASNGIISEFSTRHFAAAEITHTAGVVRLIDGASGTIIDLNTPGTVVRVTRTNAAGYAVTIGGVDSGTFAGPLNFEPLDQANLFRIENIRRSFSGTHVPSYRGKIELSHSTGTSVDRFHVVNIIEIEDYVPGVVANESIASFEMEALKAQAIAARGYAIANIGRFRADFPYDIVDSTTSQVYRGVVSEHPRAVQSSVETEGLAASYNGTIISALYSSSMGGHTEHNEWIFNLPNTQLPGTNTTPYLRGIYDGDGTAPDFSNEAAVAAFWARTTAPDSFDDCARTATTPTGTVGNTFSRWRFVLTQAELRAKVPAGIPGTITNVQVTRRMGASGRAAEVVITLSKGGTYTISGWDPLRQFFRPAAAVPRLCGASTIAANFTLNNPSVIEVGRNGDETLRDITVWGGGWGHNVGMSQYGAHGRARAGQNFMQILKAYYTGVDIGSYPIDIGGDPASSPTEMEQTFYAPNGIGTLVIRPIDMKKLVVYVNGTPVHVPFSRLARRLVTVDVSPYMAVGVNTIRFDTSGTSGSATVNVNIQ
jgi:SpoIID/LytB domain protein